MVHSLPTNCHISTHPCAAAKLSQLRSPTTNARDVKILIHEIALIVGCEALAHGLKAVQAGTSTSPLGYPYTAHTIQPPSTAISLVPILRSGLSMLDALTSLLPDPVRIHHLGLYREKSTLQPVEYYNNLPYHRSSASTSSRGGRGKEDDDARPSELAIVIDPVIATGATAMAAVETLRDWGVRRVIVICVLGSREGVRRVSESWGENGDGEGLETVQVFCAGLDEETDLAGMIKPGLGDVGDRLYLTIGK